MKINLFEYTLFLIIYIKLTNQNIIGFYQTYTTSDGYKWEKCHSNCYTCNEGESDGNQHCLSCDENKGRYFKEGDTYENCYKKNELPPNEVYFLDKKQTPGKWVKCHPNCKSCSKNIIYGLDQTTIIQMNCDECKDNFIKVNTFCYEKDNGDTNLGFKINAIDVKHCGDFKDDQTGEQLGIFENYDHCIIKPDNSYYIKNNKNNLLKYCEEKCAICEGLADNDESKCLKCNNNYIFSLDSINECVCPPHLGLDNSNCVNCKNVPERPYNKYGICVAEKGENFKLINTTYNIISNCEHPCLDCETDGKCKSCRTNYFFNPIAKANPNSNNNEICLTYKECLDLGFPNIEFNKCIFCKVALNEYKFPNSQECTVINNPSPTENGYYQKKLGYNSLGLCHRNCKTCSRAPKGDKHQNCLTCNNPDYVLNLTNCEENRENVVNIEDECPDSLYYIDNNEKICLSKGQLCPDNKPYLLQYFRLCHTECPTSNIEFVNGIPTIEENDPSSDNDNMIKKILNNECILFNNKKEDIDSIWDYFDVKINSNYNSIFGYFNTLRNLEIYNNDQSLYIFGEDTTFQITKLSHENSLISSLNSKNNDLIYSSYSNYFSNYYFFSDNSLYRNERRVSIIYLSECEKILRRLNNINPSQDILLLKLDLYRNDSEKEIMTNQVEYKIYNPTTQDEFDLTICENYPINIITPTFIKTNIKENEKLLIKLKNIIKEGYEPFILYSKFYTEDCRQFSNEYNVDVTLKDRRKDIFEKIKNFKFCEKNCYYHSTDENLNFINCICKIKTTQNLELKIEDFNTLAEENENNYLSERMKKRLDNIEKSKINDYFNFYLIKCYELLFSEKGFYYNYASFIIIGLFILYILFMLFYFCIGFDYYINGLKKFLFIKFLGRAKYKKIYYDKKTEESNNSFVEELNEKEINLFKFKKVQNRTNSDNIYNRKNNIKLHQSNQWARINKSSLLAEPVKDDQIKVVNDYKYKSNDIYKNKDNIIKDYKNDNNMHNNNNDNEDNDIIDNNANPPKRKDEKNNNYYSMANNNDLINARTIKPITSNNYDFIQSLIKGKQKSEENDTLNNNKIDNNDDIINNNDNKIDNNDNKINNNDNIKNNNDDEIINSVEEIKIEEVNTIKNNNEKNKNFNKKSEEHNTSPAIYIYNLILEKDINPSEIQDKEESIDSNIITKREYSFLNDGEINELDYDNSLVHDKRSFLRIYFSFIKYNILIFFSFLLYEDFNINFAKIALFINYLILYLAFNTMFFNNNSIHNIYINEGKYEIGYHSLRILGAFVVSLIFIKLIRLWLTFNRRKSLKMKLIKRYTDSKNEILRMIERYNLNLRIYFPISVVIILFFCYYVSVICAVYRYSHHLLLLNWIICIIFHIVYSLILNFIPSILRFLSLKNNNRRGMYAASRISSYFF